MSTIGQIARRAAVFSILATTAGVAGCGGTPEISCDEPQRYQAAQEVDEVVAPDDLDQLNEFRQLPLPEASPRPPRPEGAPCLDLPPSILGDGQ